MPSSPSHRGRHAAAVTALLVAACGGGTPVDAPTKHAAALSAFSGPTACDDLERHLEDDAVATMRSQLEAARDGTGGWGVWGGPAVLATLTGSVVAAASDSRSPAGPNAYTTTNARSAGVDEDDLVKTDGQRIVAVAGGQLQVLRSWPAEQTRALGSLPLDGYVSGLFLDGADRAIVVSERTVAQPMRGFGEIVCIAAGCGEQWLPSTRLVEVDLADPARPRITREIELPGARVAARKIDRRLHLVVADPLRWPAEMRWFPQVDDKVWGDAAALRAAWDRLIADNETLIRARALADWLPPAQRIEGGHTTLLPQACSDHARASIPTRPGTLTLATWDLASGGLDRTSILGEAGTVYASARHLWVTTPQWWSWPQIGQVDRSVVHQFALDGSGGARYLASGLVDGFAHDAFALDEDGGGALRIVTTLSRRVADPADPANTWGRVETAARLSVLERRGDALEVAGATPDLAPGERVMSARIVGTRGFVVTFRQVDPLFTIDLSDARAPRLVAELTLPGFSSYLHPLDDTHLLGIGTYLPEPEPGQPQDWSRRALQLSILDVADLAAPRETHRLHVGTLGAASEAQFDPHAFNYFAARKVLAIPFSDWGEVLPGLPLWEGLRSELRVFDIDPERGIAARGAIAMGDLYARHDDADWRWGWWSPAVRRSVLADDWVWAISDAGVRVAPLADLAHPVATVVFDVRKP